MKSITSILSSQAQHNEQLISETPFCQPEVTSSVLPFTLNRTSDALSTTDVDTINALQKEAARIAISSLISLAKAGEIDHLGGGLDLIPALALTLGLVDCKKSHFTIEHAHTSIGYYSLLAALGYLSEERVVEHFRRSLDIAGHVSWVPGGTPLNGGRLGVMIPTAVGQALGLRAHHGNEAYVVCHTGDAGWVSGQALNGFLCADILRAPVIFVMHRNGIQLSGTTEKMMPKDPRKTIEGLGITVVETESFADTAKTYTAYRDALALAAQGKPSLIYPVGYRSTAKEKITVATLGTKYGIEAAVEHFASHHKVPLSQEIVIPGSLMSYRDAHAMLECVFLVNNLPGGEGHHDGGMKGKDGAAVLANPMLQLTATESQALSKLKSASKKQVTTKARPAPGTKNLPLAEAELKAITLPTPADKPVSPRAGSEAAYAAVAAKYPKQFFVVGCDLDPSTKLGKATKLVPGTNKFEVSIQEQVATMLANGLSCSSDSPQVNVVATFAAFFEGIAREGFEMWRYQRNLNGKNEGLNVIMHLSHVGVCTGRDHFSGWSMDWINLAIGYLPYLHRFYAPADARSACLAVTDAAAHYGAHIVAIPRDNLPVLAKQGTQEPLYNPTDAWQPVSELRKNASAKIALVAIGAPASLCAEAADTLCAQGKATDAFIVNGLPLDDKFIQTLSGYDRVVTIEDGLIGDQRSGLRGLAGLLSTCLRDSNVSLKHLGIVDPKVAPAEHFHKLWEFFGITAKNLVNAALEA